MACSLTFINNLERFPSLCLSCLGTLLNCLLAALVLIASPAQAQTITDSTGRQFQSETAPKRIICLYGGLSEILIALGATDRLVARTAADSQIPEIAHLPAIGTHMRPNHELIASARPDLVLQMRGRPEAERDLEALENLGIPVLAFDINSFDQLFDITLKLGRLTGLENRAEELVTDWKTRLTALEAKYRDYPGVSVFYEVRYPNLLAAGSSGLVDEIIRYAGGQNVVRTPKRLVRLSEETAITANPQAYLIQQGPMNPHPQALAERAHFKNLKARSLVVDEYEFARPGPRSVDAAEKLAHWLHGQ